VKRQDADIRSIEQFGKARSAEPNCEILDLAPIQASAKRSPEQ
jgi:hypothetical protein